MNTKHNRENLKAVTALASLALALVLCACSTKDEAEQATAESLQAQLVAEREMMTRILVNEMHGITGITHKESKIETSLGEMAVTEYYRGDTLILKRVVPPDASHYTVYYVIHNGFEILTYKSGTAGTEFAGAGVIRDMVKPDYTIKMVGDKGGKIHRITIYSPDFSKTYESFSIKDNELIPWSAEQLQGWRKMRDPGARDEK